MGRARNQPAAVTTASFDAVFGARRGGPSLPGPLRVHQPSLTKFMAVGDIPPGLKDTLGGPDGIWNEDLGYWEVKLNSGHKGFDRQCRRISPYLGRISPNFISTQCSNVIRAVTAVQPDGKATLPGLLRDRDLTDFYLPRHMPQEVKDAVRQFGEQDPFHALRLYMFMHDAANSTDGRVVHGYIITEATSNRFLQLLNTGTRPQNSQKVLDAVAPYIATAP